MQCRVAKLARDQVKAGHCPLSEAHVIQTTFRKLVLFPPPRD